VADVLERLPLNLPSGVRAALAINTSDFIFPILRFVNQPK
jgi:hypothetical protein